MQMHPITSSQIREIGHDASTETLAVRFNTGALYHYAAFPAAKFAQFMESESKGGFFGKNVKGAHEYTRINEDEKER